MTINTRHFPALQSLSLLLLAATLGPGCAPEPPQVVQKRFVPAADLARSALEAALVDWKSGHEPGAVTGLPVGVQVIDKQRRKGQALEDFEILGESRFEAARCFAVRVNLQHPPAEEKVRFLIVGIDPLWIFREEDYETLSQWSCGKVDEELQASDQAPPVPESPATPETDTDAGQSE